MRKRLLIFFYLSFSQNLQIFCESNTEIQKTFELLEQGEKQIKLSNKNDVVVTFGTTGSGKSTFIQWIAGDTMNLISEETRPGSNEYLIKDSNDKIGSSRVSKTLFPELVVDFSTGTQFYDFPGFSDTRSPSHDIAASFFMKSVMDQVENVKILFITSYYTVQEGMDRTAFPGLLKNINDMIGDVDKFKNSIALVVSKVDNTYIKQGRTHVMKPDSSVIEGIANYLLEARKEYEVDLRRSDMNEKKLGLCSNAVKIINILLTQKNGEYPRIILFRRPDEAGTLSDIVLLREGKVIAQQLILKQLRFSKTDRNDFGFTISDESKLEISSLVNTINDQVTDIVGEIAQNIKDKLKSFVEPVREKIETFNIEALNAKEATEFSVKSDNAEHILSEAVDYFTYLSGIGELGEVMSEFLIKLDVEKPESFKENMSKFSKYLEFFQLFHQDPLPISSLSMTNSFQTALHFLADSKQIIRDKATTLAEAINSQISVDVESIAVKVKNNFTEDVDRMTEIIKSVAGSSNTVEANPLEAIRFRGKLLTGDELLTELVEKVKILPAPLMLNDEISKTLGLMNIEGFASIVLSDIIDKAQKLETLQTVSGTSFVFPSVVWSNSFKTVVAYIHTLNIFPTAKHCKEIIESKVDSLLKTVADNVRRIVDKEMINRDPGKVGDELKRWHSLFALSRDVFTVETSLEWLIDDIATCLLKLNGNTGLVQITLGCLEEQMTNLQFINALLEGKIREVPATPAWKLHIIDLVEYLDVQISFNDFVLTLYDTLSQFKVQSDVSKYNVLDLSHWGKPEKPQGVRVDKNNFRLFMEVADLNITATEKTNNIAPSETQILILNNVLMTTLQQRVVTQCPSELNSKIVLKANFIKFSDFLDSKGKFKGCEWKKVSSLEIYALDTLFIDTDLDASGVLLKLSIVARKWEVIGSRRIILDGKDGESIPAAANASLPGGHGQNGLPGAVGGSAGAFFGVVSEFVKSEKLTITANGGSGGTGQSGGNGGNGRDGETPNDLDICDLETYRKNQFRAIEIYSRSALLPGKFIDFIILGHDGTNGGNAGSYGAGGLGGLKGQISILSLTEISKELTATTDGTKGKNGTSGLVGLGGSHGKYLKVECEQNKGISLAYSMAGLAAGVVVGGALIVASGGLAAAFIGTMAATSAAVGTAGVAAVGTATVGTVAGSKISELSVTSRIFKSRGSAFNGKY